MSSSAHSCKLLSAAEFTKRRKLCQSKSPEEAALFVILPNIDRELLKAPIHSKYIDVVIPRTIAGIVTYNTKEVMRKTIKSLLIRGYVILGASVGSLTIRIQLVD